VIGENQSALDALHSKLCEDDKRNGNGHAGHAVFRTNEEILAKCRAASNAPKFSALYDEGDALAYHGGDASSADFSLIRMFRFYTQDAEQIDQLMQGSALQRTKWNESRSGKTWLRYSIDNALRENFETYPWPVDKETRDTNFVSSEYKNGGSDETKPVLKFCTGRKIAESVPEETEWIVAPWFAAGAITEISGPIKAAGKTTFTAHACRKVLDGAPFMGGATERGAVVYLTEQAPASFRKVIEAAKLDSDDFHVLYWHEARDIAWPALVKAAADHAESVGARLLVVDVLSRWCGLEGDGENSTGAALEAMAPLKEAAGRGLAVVYLRHDRKSGGEVGQSGRGSSQFGGDADQLIQISRPSGNDARPTVRVLEAIGRFGDDTPAKVNIELHNEEYRVLGDAAAFARENAMRTVCEVLPATPSEAIESSEVVTRATDKGCKRTAVTSALKDLAEANTIVRIGAGKKGDPHRYYKPLPGEEPQPGFYSSEPPIYSTDETNSDGFGTDPEREVKRLVREGMSESLARREVYDGAV